MSYHLRRSVRYTGKGWDVTYIVCADSAELGVDPDQPIKATAFKEGDYAPVNPATRNIDWVTSYTGGELFRFRTRVRLFANNECYRLMGFRPHERMTVWCTHAHTVILMLVSSDQIDIDVAKAFRGEAIGNSVVLDVVILPCFSLLSITLGCRLR